MLLLVTSLAQLRFTRDPKHHQDQPHETFEKKHVLVSAQNVYRNLGSCVELDGLVCEVLAPLNRV